MTKNIGLNCCCATAAAAASAVVHNVRDGMALVVTVVVVELCLKILIPI